jgi:hypothetical protein
MSRESQRRHRADEVAFVAFLGPLSEGEPLLVG